VTTVLARHVQAADLLFKPSFDEPLVWQILEDGDRITLPTMNATNTPTPADDSNGTYLILVASYGTHQFAHTS